MISQVDQRLRALWAHSLLLPLLLACLAGCDRPKRDPALPKGGQGAGDGQLADATLPSAHQFLVRQDFEKFRPGRARDEILKDVQWRGGPPVIAEYKGKSVCGIGYQLVFQEITEASADEGEWVFAIFLDDKFEKFVRPPKTRPEDIETFDVQGTPASRPKPIKVGDLKWLIRAIESEPVDFAALEKEVRARPVAPEHIDYGLTVAWLILKATAFRGKDFEADYGRNRQLRDQYNAARLNLGMTKAEVEAVLGGKAIESGQVEAGSYSIYGSDESFLVHPSLHYSNIFVVFRDGKAHLIFGIDGGEGWRRKLEDWYLDFRR